MFGVFWVAAALLLLSGSGGRGDKQVPSVTKQGSKKIKSVLGCRLLPTVVVCCMDFLLTKIGGNTLSCNRPLSQIQQKKQNKRKTHDVEEHRRRLGQQEKYYYEISTLNFNHSRL